MAPSGQVSAQPSILSSVTIRTTVLVRVLTIRPPDITYVPYRYPSSYVYASIDVMRMIGTVLPGCQPAVNSAIIVATTSGASRGVRCRSPGRITDRAFGNSAASSVAIDGVDRWSS